MTPPLTDVMRDQLRLRIAEATSKPSRDTVQVPGPALQPKQQRATELADQVEELLYGGSAGGGKSVWLRHYIVREALLKPNAYIGLVRRDLQRLKKTHARPLTQLLRGVAVLNRSDWAWTFPNGSVIQFIGLPHDGDELNFNSTEFDLLAFDELTEFLESQYTYMLSRLRSTTAEGNHISLPHAVSATNPIGVGYSWVKRRWVKPRAGDLAEGQEQPQEFELWQPPLPDGSGELGPSRAFVPATVFDNPALLQSNPQYVRRLKAEPDSRKRDALLKGDWDAMDQVPNALWKRSNIDANRTANHPDLYRLVVAIDPAGTAGPYSDETGIIAAGRCYQGHGWVLADRSGKYAPAAWARAALDLYRQLQADAVVIEKTAGAGSDSLIAVLTTEAQGMVREGLLTMVPRFVPVSATRGKLTRAEPAAALYLQDAVHHVGEFTELEEQLTTWLPSSGYSPDRLDALVWALDGISGAYDDEVSPSQRRRKFSRTR